MKIVSLCFTNSLGDIELVGIFLIYELFDCLLIILYFRKIADETPEFTDELTFK